MTLGEWYLANAGGMGSLTRYHDGLTRGERIGQAFFNALPGSDQALIVGTMEDPFHRNNNECVERAVDFLTR